MKKIILLSAALAVTAISFAQDEEVKITGTKKITEDVAPSTVVADLHKRFPDAKSVEYFQVPKGGVTKQGWAVTKDDNFSPDASLDYYTISFKRDDLKYYGLYRADGTLVRSKLQENNTALPDAVKNAITNISKSHPGYTVTEQTYYKNIDHEKNTEYYEIHAEKGSTKKRVYFAPDGTVLKVKG
ncbi:hypothetical protein [Flavihumibacter petaseus]|uniref:Beta-lactamase-inhibitor-like PepSY-like domain-containing protein n=1 Tax=Flavihumibacter petaseus NBRC 106054 TaxID=1220578 RepID=A0A0E9MUL0_9BACT|nr:hypothetical protein [Flavihumibacter petaseus]GAO41106.1 hypothetical protein FPE01S_01_01180 [Flavihumibacter petaseus NBRC 106054]